jgi:NAD(P)-dependent dehydrogenase (short-subunit alcohol dehydrogenase family)
MSPQRVLVTAGARVFACDIDAAALESLTREISGVRTGVCDVSKRADVERMVVDGVAALGGLDVLVNNSSRARVSHT